MSAQLYNHIWSLGVTSVIMCTVAVIASSHMLTPASHNNRNMGTRNGQVSSLAYVSVTILHSAALWPAGSPNLS